MNTVVLATGNKGKLSEFKELLKDFELEVKSLSDFPEIGDIPETGDTFYANSLIKAKAVAEITGLVAVADDSGLEVDALDGAPGVYSARYSGENANSEKNNAKLLDALKDIHTEQRTARFRCTMVAYAPSGESITADGKWDGIIAEDLVGDNGFGYDPLFIDPETGKRSAELSKPEKNSKSHRGNALKALLSQWPDFWHKVCK